jgi:O-Antigen ligase
MKFKLKIFINFAVIFSIYTGFQGARYFLQNRLQELGFALLILVFLYASTLAAFSQKNKDIGWNKWFFTIFIFIAYVMVFPAYLFSKHTGAPIAPSVMASREFMGIILGPCLYYLYRCGYTMKELEKLVAYGLGAIIITYIICNFTISKEAWFFSSDGFKRGVVAFDFRGYRLMAPYVALQIAVPYFGYKAYAEKEGRLFNLFFLSLYIWSFFLYQSRSLNAAVVVGIIFFFVFLKSKKNGPLFLMALPLLFWALVAIGYNFIHLLMEQAALGADVRLHAIRQAIEQIQLHPFFGMGMMSTTTLTDGAFLNNKYFFAVDIGLIGIAYRYGLVGALIYLIFVIYAFIALINTHFRFTKLKIKTNPLIFALLTVMVGQIFKYTLSVDFILVQGNTLAGIIIAFNAIIRADLKKLENKQRANQFLTSVQ